MRLCLLESSYDGSLSEFRGHDDPSDAGPFLAAAHEVTRCLVKKVGAAEQIAGIAAGGDIDVFVNFCDGARDEDRAGIEVVEALERMRVAFTGAGSRFYEPTRAEMRAACATLGITTPRAVDVKVLADVMATGNLRTPLIVKHPNSYGSIGLTPSSRVTDRTRLAGEIVRMCERAGGALVEEFIEGREFTVLVAEDPDDAQRPIALRPIEYRFPPGETFKHFGLKWITPGDLTAIPCEEPSLIERLKDISRRLFVALGGTGYARCDLRMNGDGELFLLEINPNCGVFCGAAAPGSADVILAHDPIGERGFVDLMLRGALARRAEVTR